jgi:hypothetical protein
MMNDRLTLTLTLSRLTGEGTAIVNFVILENKSRESSSTFFRETENDSPSPRGRGQG